MTENDPEHPSSSSSDRTTVHLPGVDEPELREPTQGEPPLPPEDQATIEALNPGTALLVVLRGPNTGARFLLDAQEVTVGRNPDSDIFLDDVTVSRKHATFRREGDGYAVADVGSLNGSYVNRERIDLARLTTGDEVQIGKFRLVYYGAGRRDQ